MTGFRWSSRELARWCLKPAFYTLFYGYVIAGPGWTAMKDYFHWGGLIERVWLWTIAPIWVGVFAGLCVISQGRLLSTVVAQDLTSKWCLVTAAGASLASLEALIGQQIDVGPPFGLAVVLMAFSLPAVQYLALKGLPISATTWVFWSGLGWLCGAIVCFGIQKAFVPQSSFGAALGLSTGTLVGCLASGLVLSQTQVRSPLSPASDP